MPFNRFVCKHCKRPFKFHDKKLGQTIKCPHCKQAIQLPSAEDIPQSSLEREEPAKPLKKSADDSPDVELFAPGFFPHLPDQDPNAISGPTKSVLPNPLADVIVLDGTESYAEETSTSSASEEHPKMPPKFQSTQAELDQLRYQNSNKRNTELLVLPTATGALVELDASRLGIKTHSGRHEIRALPKEKKERRRRIRSLLVYAFSMVLLIAALILIFEILSRVSQ
ncbi:MAG TPA: hypothetical protein PKD64_07200 [Pirellulaceae bacterium]|nr:hypothetical protein [Pirellulaceae bacterium]HMO91971.1 hypothetical protein [Pirellulaceae bacterium]HMP68770.1 hypothetical protein [Pirellulaceae bacterium]